MKPTAAIAYFALFSLFHLTLLAVAIAGIGRGPVMDQRLIVQRLAFAAPALGQLLGQNIDDIVLARKPITTFALLTLTWSSSTIFYMLTNSLNQIWGSDRGRPLWQRRGLAIVIVLAFIVLTLFLVSFAGSIMATLRGLLPTAIFR